MNKRHNFLPNNSFANATGCCCCGGGAFSNTNFGQWVDSGFQSKKKREQEAQNATPAPAVVPTVPVAIAAPAFTQTDNAPVVSACYNGNGISDSTICKVGAKYNFGNVPSICSVIGANASGTAGATPAATKSTNWVLWGIGGTAAIAGLIFIVKKFKHKA